MCVSELVAVLSTFYTSRLLRSTPSNLPLPCLFLDSDLVCGLLFGQHRSVLGDASIHHLVTRALRLDATCEFGRLFGLPLSAFGDGSLDRIVASGTPRLCCTALPPVHIGGHTFLQGFVFFFRRPPLKASHLIQSPPFFSVETQKVAQLTPLSP